MSDQNPDAFDSFEDYDYRETEEYKRHERAIRKFREMSDDEKLQTFIDAGIYNENWELTRKYGGEAPNVDEDDE